MQEQQPETAGAARHAAATAGERLSDVGGEASARAHTLSQSARDEAAALTQDATRRLGRLWDDAQHELRRQAGEQSARMQDALGSWADEVHALSEGRVQDAPRLRPMVDRTADAMASAVRRFEAGGIEGELEDLRRVARRRPGLFLLGAAVAGFGAGRLLRGQRDSSSQPAMPAGDVATRRQPAVAVRASTGGTVEPDGPAPIGPAAPVAPAWDPVDDTVPAPRRTPSGVRQGER